VNVCTVRKHIKPLDPVWGRLRSTFHPQQHIHHHRCGQELANLAVCSYNLRSGEQDLGFVREHEAGVFVESNVSK
jgi:hypothetical protein